MKNLMNLKGAKALNKKEQQSINGGGGGLCFDECYGPSAPCPTGSFCLVTYCFPAGPNDPLNYLFGTCVINEQ